MLDKLTKAFGAQNLLDHHPSAKFDTKRIHKYAEEMNRAFAIDKMSDQNLRDLLEKPEDLKTNMNNLFVSTYTVTNKASFVDKMQKLTESAPGLSKGDEKYNNFLNSVKEISSKKRQYKTADARKDAFNLVKSIDEFVSTKRKLKGIEKDKYQAVLDALAIVKEEVPGTAKVVDSAMEKVNRVYGIKDPNSSKYVKLDGYGINRVNRIIKERNEAWENLEMTDEMKAAQKKEQEELGRQSLDRQFEARNKGMLQGTGDATVDKYMKAFMQDVENEMLMNDISFDEDGNVIKTPKNKKNASTKNNTTKKKPISKKNPNSKKNDKKDPKLGRK
jgi:hypothetical protein